ncbi:hypothetical protein, partial [Vibrio parahaemolyticus]|uniref:hypothetical protein n=1 Tax=Vibrio parahaemolyticus TaxID=670 RepID=UPI001171651A
QLHMAVIRLPALKSASWRFFFNIIIEAPLLPVELKNRSKIRTPEIVNERTLLEKLLKHHFMIFRMNSLIRFHLAYLHILISQFRL